MVVNRSFHSLLREQTSPATPVIGREAELGVIDQLLTQARSGTSGVLILRGETGVGKSALLTEAADRAIDMHILDVTGVESEIEMPFAGLHQLLWPVIDRIGRLPGQQATALAGALGLDNPEPGGLFLIGVALLTLLADMAEEHPVLLLVDDAQWLDEPSATALTFAVRRLEAEPVVGLFAVREGSVSGFRMQGLPVLDIKGLPPESAEHLLDDLEVEVAPEVRRRLIADTSGNPMALKELPSLLSVPQLEGREPLPSWLPLPDRMAHVYRERVQQLPVAAQEVLLLAAAASSLDLKTLDVAAAQVGGSSKTLGGAEAAGLIQIEDGEVRFPHPLIRSAVYQGATQRDRIDAHRALAGALTREEDHDLHIWHLALATTRPNEEVAAELESVASISERRRGPAAAVASLERSAELTEDDGLRARRLAQAAGVSLEGGRRDRAQALLDEAELVAQDPHVRAQITFCRARLAMQTTISTNADVDALLQGARLVEKSDPEFAVNMLGLGTFLGWFGRDWAVVAEAARHLLVVDVPEDSPSKRRARVMLDVLESRGSSPATFLELADETMIRQLPSEVWMPPPVIDIAGWEVEAYPFLMRAARDLRGRGAIWGLTPVLVSLGAAEYLLGSWSSSVTHLTEGLSLARQIGHEFQAAAARALLARTAAIRGDAQKFNDLAHEQQPAELTCWLVAGFNAWGAALLDLGRGQAEQAFNRLAALEPPETWPQRDHIALRSVGDLVEAAIQSGRGNYAAIILDRLERWAGPDPPTWSQLILHGYRGVLAPTPDLADRHFRTALALPGGDRRPWAYARIQLLYGEWLRRQKRRTEARTQLRRALDVFDRLGAQPWSQRARAGLRASGVTLSRRGFRSLEKLTPQELQIATMAAEGSTNRQIGAQLFLSPRTVGTHLYRLFPKLGISSRADLRNIKLSDLNGSYQQ
jgi:DNA-binding CsgD family transcriptional regulator